MTITYGLAFCLVVELIQMLFADQRILIHKCNKEKTLPELSTVGVAILLSLITVPYLIITIKYLFYGPFYILGGYLIGVAIVEGVLYKYLDFRYTVVLIKYNVFNVLCVLGLLITIFWGMVK